MAQCDFFARKSKSWCLLKNFAHLRRTHFLELMVGGITMTCAIVGGSKQKRSTTSSIFWTETFEHVAIKLMWTYESWSSIENGTPQTIGYALNILWSVLSESYSWWLQQTLAIEWSDRMMLAGEVSTSPLLIRPIFLRAEFRDFQILLAELAWFGYVTFSSDERK